VGTGVYQGDIRAYAMIPDDIVPVLLQSFTAEGRDDGIELRWSLGLYGDGLAVFLERALSAEGPWQRVTAPVQRSGADSVVLDGAVQAGRSYHYRLSLGDAGETTVLAAITAERTALGAAGVVLGSPAPNPSRAGTAVSYRLPAAQPVLVTVHDLRGRLVRTLQDGGAAFGEHRLEWDGRGGDGRRAPAGVYLIKLRTPEAVRTQRVTLTR
jgi:hypothetical protein